MPPHRVPLTDNELLGEERELRRRVATLVRRRRAEPNPEPPPVHFLDRALTASLEQHNEVVWRRLADKSHGLSEARARLQEGTYGTCHGCGCRIPPRRLRAVPTATLCVPCQARLETTGSLRSNMDA